MKIKAREACVPCPREDPPLVSVVLAPEFSQNRLLSRANAGMATLAVQAIAQVSETVSTASAAAAGALVAPNEIEGYLAKRHSADGAVLCKVNAAPAEAEEEGGHSDSAVSSRFAGSMTGESEGRDRDSDELVKEDNKVSMDSKCSQGSGTSQSSVESSVSSAGKSNAGSSKSVDEDSNSSSNSTLKAQDENSQSSASSSKTVKSSRAANEESDGESNSKSSCKSSSVRSSPEKQSQSQSTVKSTQSTAKDISEDDSRDSSTSSHSISTKSSQNVNDKSDNESNSRSTFKSVSRKDSPTKQSQSQSTTKSSQSVANGLSDDDSNTSFANSHTKSTKASSQIVDDKSDSESNTTSSRRSSPEKESQSQSANHNLLEDNETRSSFTNSQSKSTKNKRVIDTSDDESNSRSSFKMNSNKSSPPKENENNTQKKKYFSIVDSDSEDDIIVPKKSNKSNIDSHSADSDANKKSKTKKAKRIKNVFDSDSDEDSVKDKKSESKKSDSDQSDSDEDKGNSNSMNKSNKISDLIDSDSESDHDRRNSETENVSAGEENDAEKPKKGKKTSEKKRTGSARASKDAAMQQIYSETQRLIRESQLSLPYHRPKHRTLQEFLNRKKINISIQEIPKNLTSAEKVKMFPEMISKAIEEKEKEAEIFYQSSESEEDENTEEPMEVDECNKDSEINTGDANNVDSSDAINISDTQRLTQDFIQESHNKREILQQRSLDFGVPRKLFMEDVKDSEDSESNQKDEDPNNEENTDSENLMQLNKKPKEVKTGLRESSVSKKLFTTESEEMEVDVDAVGSVSTSEEKTENIKESAENSETNAPSTEKKMSNEDSTEDFVLQLAETEVNNKTTEFTESIEINSEKKDQESIMIGETPFKSHKELGKTDTSKSDETEKSEDVLETSNKDLDKDDEIVDHNVLRADFGLPPELDEPVKKPTMKEKLLASSMKFKPKIKASPGVMIDFTDNGKMKEGVSKLLDRFARHSAKLVRPNDDDVSEVKVMRTEGSGNDITVIEETLPFTKAIVEDDPKKESKPGEKLKKLREDLKRKIVTARNEEWKQKEDKQKEDEEEEGKCKGDDFYADLPDDEEILEDEESAESEPEEDDVPIVDKPRKKCDFGDEEAEESEDEGAEDNEVCENDEDEEEEEDQDEEQEEDDDTEKEEEEAEEICDKPKKLKRIIRAFDEDSNQSETSLSNDALPKQTLERTKTDEDMFASQTSNGSDGDVMPPFQPRSRCGSDARSQSCKTPLLKSNNILSMISPVAQLTCLNTSLDSEKKSASKTNSISLGIISTTKSPPDKSDQSQNNCHMEKMISLPKKLFDDPPESVNDEELLAICSGKFTDTQSSGVPVLNTQNGVTDSQLLAICSGAFTSQTINEKKSDSANPMELVGDETSQDITLTLDDDEESRSSPNKKSSSAKKSDESMFSNDSKSPVKLPSFSASAFKNPMEAWLSKAKPKPVQSQKREVTDSQIMDICSGAFPSQTVKTASSEKCVSSKEDQNKLFESQPCAVNDEELLALCSGKFPDTQVSGIPSLDIQNGFQKKLFDKPSNKVNEDDLLEICSGAFPDTQMPGVPPIATQNKSNSTAPVSPSKEKEDDDSKTPWTGYTIVSSSDDEENKAKTSQKKKKLKKKKKKVQQLALSDDEDDEPKEFSDEEEEVDEIGDEDDEQFVDYDSEENEVITVSKKDIKKVATKYLENEAELSESDWDSADEDEQDLDKLEFEEGDAEEIDENKMKDELDKIHMKQVMDEDQREVRMLQELLFDDGDLHSEGAGRERKFKWKNIDNIDDDHLGPRSENDADGIDDEVDTAAEIQMRKARYERQKFLEEQEKNLNKQLDDDDDFSECQLGKLGLKLISMRSSSKSSTEETTIKSSTSSSNDTVAGNRLINVTNKTITTSRSFSFSNMRGSFLSRGEETLTRIAKNLPETNKLSINAVRNRKFVFEHLSPSVSEDNNDDEQENDDTPAKEKNKSRKRKIFSSQTPRTTKKMKLDERTAGKKLF